MNANKQSEDPNDLPMVEFHDDDCLPPKIVNSFPPPPPLPITVTTIANGRLQAEGSKPPVCQSNDLNTFFKAINWPELLFNCDPRSWLVAAILIPYLWLMMAGVTNGNVSWGVVMLLAGGCLTLGWYSFLGLSKLSTRRGEEIALRAVQVFLATAVIGVLLLLLFQGALFLVDDYWKRPGGGVWGGFIFLIIKILATGYHTAFSEGPFPNPVWYFLCTFVSVAFCEELLKLSPVILLHKYRQRKVLANTSANISSDSDLLFLGAMSGLGFGFSEGLMYTADFYRPLQLGFSIYFTRFMCVAIMHGLWSYLSSTLYLRIVENGFVQQRKKQIGLAILGSMLLHALHNTASTFEASTLGLLGITLTIATALLVSGTIRPSQKATSPMPIDGVADSIASHKP